MFVIENKKVMEIDYDQFKALEAFKKKCREELLEELRESVVLLSFCDSPGEPRNGSMVIAAEAEDIGFRHAIQKVKTLISTK